MSRSITISDKDGHLDIALSYLSVIRRKTRTDIVRELIINDAIKEKGLDKKIKTGLQTVLNYDMFRKEKKKVTEHAHQSYYGSNVRNKVMDMLLKGVPSETIIEHIKECEKPMKHMKPSLKKAEWDSWKKLRELKIDEINDWKKKIKFLIRAGVQRDVIRGMGNNYDSFNESIIKLQEETKQKAKKRLEMKKDGKPKR